MARVRVEVCDAPHRCREIVLVKPVTTIGRGSNCDIRIASDAVSSQHAKLRIYSTHAVVEDTGSLNGVLANGQRIAGAIDVGQGTVIQLGPGGPTVRILDGVPPLNDHCSVSPTESLSVMTAPTGRRSPTTLYWMLAACAALFVFTSCTAVIVAVAWYSVSPSQLRISSLDDHKILAQAVGLVIARHELFSDGESIGHLKPFTGSAFAITTDGHMITNKHVVSFEITKELAAKVRQETGQDVDDFRTKYWVAVNGTVYDAVLTHRSSGYDLAMLKVNRKDEFHFFELSELKNFKPRLPVVALGFPGASRIALSEEEKYENAIRSLRWREDVKSNFKTRDFILTVTEGKVTQDETPEGVGRLWLSHDAEISGGNSGGPLCNEDGVVLGINTASYGEDSRVNLALMTCQLRNEIETVTRDAIWTD